MEDTQTTTTKTKRKHKLKGYTEPFCSSSVTVAGPDGTILLACNAAGKTEQGAANLLDHAIERGLRIRTELISNKQKRTEYIG